MAALAPRLQNRERIFVKSDAVNYASRQCGHHEKSFHAGTLQRNRSGVNCLWNFQSARHCIFSFRPDRPIPNISQVGFRGNDALPTTVLQIAMNQIAMGAIFKEEMVRQYLETTIRPIYEKRGPLEGTFPKVMAQPSPDNSGINVMIEVVEEPSFDIGAIRLVGPIGDPKALYPNDGA